MLSLLENDIFDILYPELLIQSCIDLKKRVYPHFHSRDNIVSNTMKMNAIDIELI